MFIKIIIHNFTPTNTGVNTKNKFQNQLERKGRLSTKEQIHNSRLLTQRNI